MWKDPLCGASVLKVDSMNLLKFAEHWGNFALRQFALAFVTPDEVWSKRLIRLTTGAADSVGWGWGGIMFFAVPSQFSLKPFPSWVGDGPFFSPSVNETYVFRLSTAPTR